MRVFNIFKLGSKIMKYEGMDQKKNTELVALHQIQDRVVVQIEREKILKDELIKTQEELSKKSVELEKIRHSVELVEN
jgi:hypothetical protein